MDSWDPAISLICRRQDFGNFGIGNSAGEGNELREIEVIAQGDQVLEAIARPDEREADVTTADLAHDDVGELQHEVDAILWSHHADVCNQIALVALRCRIGDDGAMESGRIGTGADDRNLRGIDAVTARDELSVGVVRRDDVVCRTDRARSISRSAQ